MTALADAVRRPSGESVCFSVSPPPLAVGAHRGAVVASGHHVVVVVYAKNNLNTLETEFACTVLSLQGSTSRISNVAHTPPIPSLNPQQRVRVAAERLVARTRSESSSSAFKVPKSCLLHCYCGGRLHLDKPPPCSSPNQDSTPVLQLVSVIVIFGLPRSLIMAVSLA